MSANAMTSVTKKVWMALMGLFLLAFLPVHMGINFLIILFPGDHEPFNLAANFMGTNPAIKVMEIGLFAGFLVHMIMGMVLAAQNRKARPVRYAVASKTETRTFSKQMVFTAILIGIFLVIHMMDFYLKAKVFHGAPEFVTSTGVHMHDMAQLVIEKFNMPLFAIGYAIIFIILGLHMWHGFTSVFQSLGLNNQRVWNPIIKGVGAAYVIIVAGGFLVIDLVIFLSDKF